MTGIQPPGVPTFYPGAQRFTSTVTQLNSVQAALTFLLLKPSARLRRAATAAATAGTWAKIPFDTADEDTYSGWSASPNPTRYTCQAPGWYLVTAGASLDRTTSIVSGTTMSIGISINGGPPYATDQVWQGAEQPASLGTGGPHEITSAWEVYLSLGDYLELAMYYSAETAAANIDTTSGWWPRMAVVWSGS